jgi:hypothetical protein
MAMNTMRDPILNDLAGSAADVLVVSIMTAVDTMDNPIVKQTNEILAKYLTRHTVCVAAVYGHGEAHLLRCAIAERT